MPLMTSWSMKTTCSFIQLGGGLRPPSDVSPQKSLRRRSRRSNSDRVLASSPVSAGGHAGAQGVEVLDHVLVPHPDRRAADLLGSGQLVIVGVELLVEQGESADPGDGREALV